jgi:hypothetical protein
MKNVFVLLVIAAVVIVLLTKVSPLLGTVIEELQYKVQNNNGLAILYLGILLAFVLAVIALVGRFFGRQ